jgi:hypothetical protein
MGGFVMWYMYSIGIKIKAPEMTDAEAEKIMDVLGSHLATAIEELENIVKNHDERLIVKVSGI